MVALLRDERYDILPFDQVVHGECLSVMRAWPDNCIDSAVLDPPAGIFFMSKKFDHDRGGRDKWIAWLAEIMREVLRVLKPGASCLVWSLPRTSHWTGLALEQAGFEMRDCLYHLHSPDSALATFHASLTETQRDALERLLDSQEVPASLLHLFSTGFPKSLDVGKAVHKHLDVEREVTGTYKYANRKGGKVINAYMADWGERAHLKETSPSPSLQQYEGIGSALKPACENWWLCRKPLGEKSIAENVLRYGTGGLNIDKSRVGHHEPLKTTTRTFPRFNGTDYNNGVVSPPNLSTVASANSLGRFPSNVTFTHSLFCVQSAESWHCDPSCPVFLLEQQSGVSKSSVRPPTNKRDVPASSFALHRIDSMARGHNDTGTASRFYHTFTPDPFLYAAKASRAERNKGCEGLPEQNTPDTHNLSSNACAMCGLRVKANGSGVKCECGPLRKTIKLVAPTNNHPTVKNQQLMRYLVSLITPANGIVLDCFCGSGSTLVAAITEGYHFIGIEMNNTPDEPYVDIARARVQHALAATPLNTREVGV